jgi:transcription antitermination protein NusB
MLNRRLVRIRVMQTLYALDKSKSANYSLAQDLISDHFAPDLNAIVRQDRNVLTGQKKIAQSYFEDEILKNKLPDADELNPEISRGLASAREFLKSKNKKDIDFFKREIIIDAEKVYDLYIYILVMLLELQKKFEKGSNFSKNRALSSLRDSNNLQHNALKRELNFNNDAAFITKIYTETLSKNPHIVEYLAKPNCTTEDDVAILKYFVKNVALKNDSIGDFFEKISMYWSEDTDILRTMLFHSFTDFLEKGQVSVETLDETWDETKDFMKELFESTVNNDAKLMNILVPRLKNWEIDRVIETDKVLLKMAITELTEFPSIPTKVTINEIIEISKNYSSMKSGNFVNGILDGLMKQLTTDGAIKKTGRGMLDNK